MPTHHIALTEIYNLKHSDPDQNLYVAECDIKGFFDSVDHGLALRAFHRAAQRVQLHPRAELIFQAYLDCYSFPANVLTGAQPRLKQRDPLGYFKWPADDLRKIHNTDPHCLRIGVPQGGAISGVIANLILDAADKGVEAKRAKLGADIHYYRYCDDMILISHNKRHCKKVFNAYLQQLDGLKLPFHEPEKTCIYDERHWEHKSKAPYCWSGQRWFRSVPWIQFVGYQIRYDGLVRPRKGSIARQAEKLKETTDTLKIGLTIASRNEPILANRSQVVGSLKSKLTAQGVGRIKGYQVNGPKPMCWVSGFKALHNKPFVSTVLRKLDRTRWKQIRRLGKAQIQYGTGRNRGRGKRRDPVGYAFSYHAQFTNAGGRDLIMNPWRPRNLKDKFKSWAFLTFKWCSKLNTRD